MCDSKHGIYIHMRQSQVLRQFPGFVFMHELQVSHLTRVTLTGVVIHVIPLCVITSFCV